MISSLYSKDLLEKFRNEVGSNKTVFEVAAGYGRVARFIDPSNTYQGIDRNLIFVEYGRKQGLDLEISDIFDPKAYRKSDVFVVVDLIHHLTKEELKKLFDLIFLYTREKVVIMESSCNFMKRYGRFGRLLEKIFLMFDYDGINKIERFMTDEEYRDLFENRFGSVQGKGFNLKYQQVKGRHLYQLVTFTRKEMLK